MRKSSWLFWVATVVFAGSGCTSLQSLSAGFTGCEPDEVVVTDHHTLWSSANWIATCRNRRFYCVAFGQGAVSCSPVSGPGIVNPHAPAPPLTPPPGSVERVLVESGAQRVPMVRGSLTLGAYQVQIHYTPSHNPDRVVWRVAGPNTLVRPGCDPVFIADGTVESLAQSRFATEGEMASYQFETSLDVARRLGHAQRVSGRMCENEMRWGAGERAFFEELLARMDEEIAWLNATQRATSGGEATP